MKIADDAGHGGSDPGAVDDLEKRLGDDEIYEDEIYSEESDINLRAAKIFKEKAEQRGHEVIMTRNEDKYVKLHSRSNIANKHNVDVFVSFHCNAVNNGGVSGIETLYWHKSKVSPELARCVQKELVKVSDSPDRGIKPRDNVHVLKATNMAAVLVELGFITNNKEEKLLSEDEYLHLLTEAVLKGVENYARE